MSILKEPTEINLRISSRRRTGALKYNTAFHSIQLRGVMANNVCNRFEHHK